VSSSARAVATGVCNSWLTLATEFAAGLEQLRHAVPFALESTACFQLVGHGVEISLQLRYFVFAAPPKRRAP